MLNLNLVGIIAMIANTNRRSKTLYTGSYLANAGGSITATDPFREDSTGVILSGQMTSYLTPTDMFIDEYANFAYTKPYQPVFVPVQRRKNPFEHMIFDMILSKHHVCIKNISKNVTFNRKNMKGFY